MPVQAVIREIDLPPNKPLGPRRLPLENLVPLFEPVQFLGSASPELLRFLHRFLVERLILRQALQMGILGKLRRTFELALLIKNGINVGLIAHFGHDRPLDR